MVALGTLLPSVLGLLGRWAWFLDLCNHFRFQCAAALLVTTIGLLLLRAWRIAGASLAGLMLNLAFVLPLYVTPPEAIAPDQPMLVAMHFNVNTGNTDYAGVIAEIQSHEPDLLFVQEVNNRWLDEFETGLTGYDLVAEDARADNFGIVCFIKTPTDLSLPIRVAESRIYDPTQGLAQVPVIEITLDWGGQSIKALSIHPLPPIRLPYARARDAVLHASGQWAAEQTVPHFIIGDFNVTPWSTAFRDMQSAGGLVNSQIGFGQSPTWPAGLGILGMIPIDHLLHSDDLVTVDRQVGKARGSDHKPLIVTLGRRDVD